MKFTLAQNAISSLNIAIENFKKFYYLEDEYNKSEVYESIKICIVFLENSIELMLKTILVSTNPLSIYRSPDSQVIKDALLKLTSSTKLEDILISEGNFQTITYLDTIKKYNKIYHDSKKVYCILTSLGEKRNAITHFGIDETNNLNELIICIINTFDVIYNYLYPRLIDLDEIGEYFTSDDLIVNTVLGEKLLLDNNYLYNNIVDFLDELMENSKEYICSIRALNPQTKIFEFTKIMSMLVKDKELIKTLEYNQAYIEFITSDFDNNNYCFDIFLKSEMVENIISCYSPFYNATAFCGESGNIYFLVIHDESVLYIYNSDEIKWPQCDEPEPDYQWRDDCTNGVCKRYNLSKQNLLLAFINILKTI